MTHRFLADELALTGHEPSTVFRCLQRLEDKGLVVKLDLGEHVDRYELADPSGSEDSGTHPHFLCVVCGEILCLTAPDVALPKSLSSLNSGIGEVTSVVLKGKCRACHRLSGSRKG